MVIIFSLIFFIANNVFSFSVKPGKFDVVCDAGNKVILQYELKCTKKIPEFIKIKYWNLKGRISADRFIMPELPIKLYPNQDAKKVKIIIRTPITNYAENILKISFVDVSTGEGGTISIASMLSTRTYIRYKDKALLSYEVKNFYFSSKRVRGGKIIKYFNLKVLNKGNTHIRPNGYAIFKNRKGVSYNYKINQFEFPVYSKKDRNLITEISDFPRQGRYDVEILVNTKLGQPKNFKYKVDICDDGKVNIVK